MFSFLIQNTPLQYLFQSFWRDEAFSYLLARHNIIDILSLTAKDFSPPLYYILLHLWMFVFGRSEVALRSLSFVFFLGSIYVFFLILRQIFHLDRKKSLMYSLLFAVNPVLLYYAFEARAYSLFVFTALLSYYAFYIKNKRIYIIATACGLLSHYFMVFVVATQIIYSLIVHIKHKKNLFQDITYMVLPGIIFLIWGIIVLINRPDTSDGTWISPVITETLWYIPAIIFTGFERIYTLKGFTQTSYDHLLSGVVLLLITILAIGLYKLILHKKVGKDKNIWIYLLLWFAFPVYTVFAISYVRPFFLPRYLIATVPGLLLLLIFSLEHMKKYVKMTLFLLLIIVSCYFHYLQIQNLGKADTRKLVEEIRPLVGKNDFVYVTDPLDFHTVEYYLNEDQVRIYGKPYSEIRSYVGKVLIPPDKIATTLPIYPQKAIIITGPTSYSIQSIY